MNAPPRHLAAVMALLLCTLGFSVPAGAGKAGSHIVKMLVEGAGCSQLPAVIEDRLELEIQRVTVDGVALENTDDWNDWSVALTFRASHSTPALPARWRITGELNPSATKALKEKAPPLADLRPWTTFQSDCEAP